MHDLRPVILTAAGILAWLVVARYSTPQMPVGGAAWLGLIAADLYLGALARVFWRGRFRTTALILGLTVAYPWLFWAQAATLDLTLVPGLTPTPAQLHALTIYNLFRYLLLAIALIALLVRCPRLKPS